MQILGIIKTSGRNFLADRGDLKKIFKFLNQ